MKSPIEYIEGAHHRIASMSASAAILHRTWDTRDTRVDAIAEWVDQIRSDIKILQVYLDEVEKRNTYEK